ncbi:MAG: hemolysin III family protein [Bacteroidetes bacterium]|nr:hemolysin III family protein [Bacteroidales bacterium]MBU1009845.1 hemolysin III family protein [Bacteroidota bacterium]
MREEIANTLSHGVGMLLATAGLTLLVVFGAIYGNVWHIVSYAVFGSCMILLYASSTVFHAATRPRVKYYLNKLDHSSIYLLIAGSYTPISLISLRGPVGWTLFGIIWALAIAGIVFKLWFYSARYRKISAWLYVVMGWMVVIAIVPVIRNVPPVSLWFLFAGGLCYTGGVLFYLKKRIRYFHFVFHLFVLAGSICHFFSFLFLIPFAG